MAKVMLIPLVVFVAGVASDFTFVYVADNQPLSAAADRYRLVEMSGWEEAVWFLGSLANIMCFVLAWVYVFDSTQLEIKALDDAQEGPLPATRPSSGQQP
ncbi:GpcrRhopsn4 domain-containing protein [Haematococcus lacustris]|uniref:GpcrRhopsn4 domain-containing protein n=1 Tax=Haematococcus lacustris TaxID=44745 RepID=A0A699YZD1_HAELA|nr:GpcrRhopsn4 domain-containing protein [Haematococcus lacustris]